MAIADNFIINFPVQVHWTVLMYPHTHQSHREALVEAKPCMTTVSDFDCYKYKHHTYIKQFLEKEITFPLAMEH